MAFFTNQLLKWYNQNKRNLPWRKTSDPYKIWISEIILQQTRIDQGTDYYLRFIKEFPNVRSLAKANPDKVLKLWQGLGYYSRARNLQHAAKEIIQKHKGLIPDTYNDLIKLKGIGDYTAGAILSIAFNKPYPVVDGNVIRVISRVFGITEATDDKTVIKKIKSLAEEHIPEKQAGTFNQALMEFGALQCKPQNPGCSDCYLNKTCVAYRKKMVNKIPVKKSTVMIRSRHLNYFMINYTSGTTSVLYLKKRMGNDIWKNLYDLPCIETNAKTSYGSLKKRKEWKELFGNGKIILENDPKTYIHKLSHQTIHAVFYNVSVTRAIKKTNFFIAIKAGQLHEFPVPRLIEMYLVSQKLLK